MGTLLRVPAMRVFHVVSVCYLTIIVFVQCGCTGSNSAEPYSATLTTTYHDTKYVVSGTVSTDANKQITEVYDVSTGSRAAYSYRTSNMFIFTNHSTVKPNRGHVFRATISDGSPLFSVWNGVESATADVIVTTDNSKADPIYSLAVTPQEPAATVNINQVTNLAYWLWQYNTNHPFSDYLGNVFLFLMDKFPTYSLPPQNAVRDNPSPELLRLLGDISITISDKNSRFTLTRKATGEIVCTGLFATFPVCQ